MYAVVEFTDGNEVELIPTNWLIKSNRQALWPPFKSTVAISKAAKSRIPPDVDVWEAFDIRVLYTCSKYTLHLKHQ